MTQPTQTKDVWARIEAEKRRDRMVRRISIIAWTITSVILLVFTVMVGIDVAEKLTLLEVGVISKEAVVSAVMPLVAVLGSVSLLIAVLSTVGVFLCLRTASLSEIQLRLAALEEVLLAGPDEGR